MHDNQQGQALVEYSLVTMIFVVGIATAQNWLGPMWPQFVKALGLYAAYSDSYDLVLSLPFP